MFIGFPNGARGVFAARQKAESPREAAAPSPRCAHAPLAQTRPLGRLAHRPRPPVTNRRREPRTSMQSGQELSCRIATITQVAGREATIAQTPNDATAIHALVKAAVATRPEGPGFLARPTGELVAIGIGVGTALQHRDALSVARKEPSCLGEAGGNEARIWVSFHSMSKSSSGSSLRPSKSK